jgi:hypothetical protein
MRSSANVTKASSRKPHMVRRWRLRLAASPQEQKEKRPRAKPQGASLTPLMVLPTTTSCQRHLPQQASRE